MCVLYGVKNRVITLELCSNPINILFINQYHLLYSIICILELLSKTYSKLFIT